MNSTKEPEMQQILIRLKDVGTPELHRDNSVEIVRGRAKNLTQTPLDFYINKGWISPAQYDAGQILYRNFFTGGFSPENKSCLAVLIGGGDYNPFGNSITDRQMEARDAMRQALRVLELEGQQLVINICCIGSYVADYGRQEKKERYYMQRLRSALTELAKHYGLIR